MKLGKALVVFSCLGVVSLTGCGGVDAVEAADEVSTGSTQQSLCADPPPLPSYCTSWINTSNLNCSTATFPKVTYMCDTSSGYCRWYGCNGVSGDFGTYGGSCAQFQANFCH